MQSILYIGCHPCTVRQEGQGRDPRTTREICKLWRIIFAIGKLSLFHLRYVIFKMHRKSSKMQFGFLMIFWRLISFIIEFCWNSDYNRKKTLLMRSTKILVTFRFATNIDGAVYGNLISSINLLVFDFHKTADKITMENWYYGWEKANFCQIHDSWKYVKW